jgi:hypothetical protein
LDGEGQKRTDLKLAIWIKFRLKERSHAATFSHPRRKIKEKGNEKERRREENRN